MSYISNALPYWVYLAENKEKELPLYEYLNWLLFDETCCMLTPHSSRKIMIHVTEDKLDQYPCLFGCIFDGGKLMGDCRMPESKDCRLNDY